MLLVHQRQSWEKWCGKLEVVWEVGSSVVSLNLFIVCSVFFRTWETLVESLFPLLVYRRDYSLSKGLFYHERKLITIIYWNGGEKREEVRDLQ